MNALPKKQTGPGRSRFNDIDQHVGARIRERRILLGLTQRQVAELIGVTFQQLRKYEMGINRIAASRLYTIAHALSVEMTFFFEGMNGDWDFKPIPQQRLVVELARNFISLPSRKQQEAICSLVRVFANMSDESAINPGFD